MANQDAVPQSPTEPTAEQRTSGGAMQGQRVEYDNDGPIPAAGSYWRQNGSYFAMTPNGHLAGLANHNVLEHEDGTITVAPSILVSGGSAWDNGIRVSNGSREVWHGYLERGVWRQV